jgi:hypothetical protein
MTLHPTLPHNVVSREQRDIPYRTDEAGLLLNLRGFWHMGVMQFEQPEGS